MVGSDKERCKSIVWTSGQTLQSLDSLFQLPPPLCVLLTLLKPKLNDSDTGVHENPPCLHVSSNVSSPDLLLWRFYDDNIWWTKDGFHNEYFCVSGGWGMPWLEYWSFQKNPGFFFPLENSLEELLNSKIRFDFKEAPALICIGIAFFLHPQFTHFHVFPLSVTCSAVSKRNTIPLSVFIWCADSAAQAEGERQEKQERREDCQTDIWETGI